MKLVHTKLARSIWLFDVRDLNPKGKDVTSDLLGWIKDAYNFAIAPDPDDPVPNAALPPPQTPQTASPQAPGGFLFQRGSFQVQEEIFVEIAALTFYNDGIVIDAGSSTSDGDRFAEDLLTSAATEFKLAYDPNETVRRKLYLSELILRSPMKLESLNPALSTFSQKLPESAAGGRPLRFGVGSVGFWSEPNDAGMHRLFTIERQLGRSFEEQRYYSQAPLETDVHFALLEDFEKLVG